MCHNVGMWALGQWWSAETVVRIADVVAAEPRISRRSLARRVCEWLRWVGPDGKTLREESGRKALAELEKRGVVRLPKARSLPVFAHKPVATRTRRRKKAAASLEIRCDLRDLGKLEVVPVTSRYSKASAIWNDLMQQHHYLGAGPLCGAQIRYLIRSETREVLGGLSFSAASKRLKSRDGWVGWSERAKRANLQKVVCNSRFLIATGVEVPNLASRALRLGLERLPKDWEQRYAVELVLVETFVDPERFKGTCYKAANWQLVGKTAAERRGSFPNGKRPTGKKQVYLYALRKDAQEVLRQEPHEPLAVRGISADAKDWADEEFLQ